MYKTDVVIIGASASGLMCGIEAGKRKRNVVILDHANKAGKKILISGGGRCNFTNYTIDANNYISHNPHFCKSALKRFTQWDFLSMVEHHGIPYHERDHGQLFCNNSARDILDMLVNECCSVGVQIRLKCTIGKITKLEGNRFTIETSQGIFQSESLVIATGGLSFPTMGASPFGYRVAEQFGIKVWPTSAGLVPFTLQPGDKECFSDLSGIAVESEVSNSRIRFRENVLFTHRGLSGPAILQVSSYWKPGETIQIDLLPDTDLSSLLIDHQSREPQKKLKTVLGQMLPKRLILALLGDLAEMPLQNLSHKQIQQIEARLKSLTIKPGGTEGYRTAEVTVGGVDCDAISSKTMESIQVSGLYFVGEVLDVTGWLGGYNFQWAWSSGWCAGQYV